MDRYSNDGISILFTESHEILAIGICTKYKQKEIEKFHLI